MIWLETQNSDLIECSMIRLVMISPIQYILQNQNGYPLIEVRSREEAIAIKDKIKEHISNGLISVLDLNKLLIEIRKVKANG